MSKLRETSSIKDKNCRQIGERSCLSAMLVKKGFPAQKITSVVFQTVQLALIGTKFLCGRL